MSTPMIPAVAQTVQAGTYTFTDDEELSAIEKQEILADWQRFLASGFKRPYFTEWLYLSLVGFGGFAGHRSRDNFWRLYCAGDLARLTLLLDQFGGSRRSAEQGTTAWLEGPPGDLKAAMCQEAARLYEPLSQVLADLEYKHTELGQAWRTFAIEAGLPDPGPPAPFQVGENCRNLLAYAAHIALHHPPPLAGLQHQFPPQLLLGQELGETTAPLVVISNKATHS